MPAQFPPTGAGSAEVYVELGASEQLRHTARVLARVVWQRDNTPASTPAERRTRRWLAQEIAELERLVIERAHFYAEASDACLPSARAADERAVCEGGR